MEALFLICLLFIVPLAIMFDKSKAKKNQNNAPAKGCLQSTFEFGFLSLFLMLAVIICIMLLIASGN